jgi:hypothetical protein
MQNPHDYGNNQAKVADGVEIIAPLNNQKINAWAQAQR